MKNILEIRMVRVFLVLFLGIGALMFAPANKTKTIGAVASSGGVLEIFKEDASTGVKLPGAVFRMTNLDTGEVTDNLVTNEYGVVRIGNLSLSDYRIEELEAPEGYSIDQPIQTIRIESLYVIHIAVFGGTDQNFQGDDIGFIFDREGLEPEWDNDYQGLPEYYPGLEFAEAL